MVLSSTLFVFLFLTAYVLSQLLLKSARAKNIAMLVFSLLFYLWAGPFCLLLLVGMVLICYLGALGIEKKNAKKAILSITITLCLVLLAAFRYSGLLLGTVRYFFGVPKALPQLLLPVGISIYTLQLISYVVDVYRGKLQALKQFWLLLLYASSFHTCMAGPFVRYQDIQQDLSQRNMKFSKMGTGISRFAMGLFKKVLLADSLAVVVNQLLIRSTEGLSAVPVTGLWLGVLLSALKLYLLFSAYADMAIGLGQISGLNYPENFDYPILSCSFRGFLSKWLITISGFFQDYVWTPMTAAGTKRLMAGALVSGLLLGLWFGGSWSYLLLGLYLALFSALERRLPEKLPKALRVILGLLGIFLFFLLFSFTTLPRLGIAVKGLFGLNHNGFFRAEAFAGIPGSIPLILAGLCFCLPLGRIIHNVYYLKFKSNPNAMTAAMIWETIYPLALIVLTFVLVALNKTPFLIF